jgi:hypothetical protein
VVIVDAANVIGSRPTGWWRDRPKAAREFVARVRDATATGRFDTPVVVVLEGQARRGVEPGVIDGVEVVHAPGEGDDTLVALALAAGVPLVLVTADRGLRERVKSADVEAVGPSWLYGLLEHD